MLPLIWKHFLLKTARFVSEEYICSYFNGLGASETRKLASSALASPDKITVK